MARVWYNPFENANINQPPLTIAKPTTTYIATTNHLKKKKKTQFRTNPQRPRSPSQHLLRPPLPNHAEELPWPPPTSHLSRSLFVTFFVYSRWVREDGKSPNEPESDELLGGFGLLGRELESERDSYRRLWATDKSWSWPVVPQTLEPRIGGRGDWRWLGFFGRELIWESLSIK